MITGSLLGQSYPPYSITTYSPTSSGYYFVCPIKVGSNPNGIVPTHMILDEFGDVVYFKPFNNIGNTGDFKVNQNGNITYSLDGKYLVMDSTFVVLDSVETPSGYIFDGHDVQLLSNGHILLLAEEIIQMDLSSYNFFGINHTNPGSANANVKCGIVLELDANKNIVFEWHAKDYYAFDDIDILFCTNPNTVDWTHFNAIELDSDSNLLVSSRHFSEITKISRSNGAILWRLSGNANQFNFLNDPTMFKRQHDIRKLSNGNYTLFDNGDGNNSSPYHTAAGKEYSIDEMLMTANLEWSYIDNQNSYSTAMGSFGRNPGGISIVGYGMNAVDDKIFTAINDVGSKILEIVFDDVLWSYRSFHYDSLPWNLNRPVITCNFNNGQYYLDAGAGYASYLWSDGSTSQTIPVITLDTFSVFIPKGDGGFISSEKFIVDNLLDPCGTVSLSEVAVSDFSLFPNPVQDFLNIEFEKLISGTIKIEDVAGKTVMQFERENNSKMAIATNSLASGLYFFHYGGKVKKIVKL